MKKDDDYIRKLLFEYEADDEWLLFVPGETFGSGNGERRERYHVLLMMDEGLLTLVGDGTMRITSAGHSYSAAIRDDGVWESTKAAVAETGGNAGLEIIKALATGFLRKKISQHTGIDL